MEEFTKDELMQIVCNYEKAAFVIAEKQNGPITGQEKLELKLHPDGSVCRLFEKQSKAINQIVKNIFNT